MRRGAGDRRIPNLWKWAGVGMSGTGGGSNAARHRRAGARQVQRVALHSRDIAKRNMMMLPVWRRVPGQPYPVPFDRIDLAEALAVTAKNVHLLTDLAAFDHHFLPADTPCRAMNDRGTTVSLSKRSGMRAAAKPDTSLKSGIFSMTVITVTELTGF